MTPVASGADHDARRTAGLRVAIVHERFTTYAGSEKVVEQMHVLWPAAPIFTSVCDPAALAGQLEDADVRTTAWLRRLYRGGDHYAHLLPLLPLAARGHDLREHDVVVASHHAFANRVRTALPTRVVSYTHTPARWMWDPRMRERESGGLAGRTALRAFAATQRNFDRRAARRLAGVIANSSEVARRIERWWGLPATVVAPPVAVEHFTYDPGTQREDFFLLAGRLVPYKAPEIAVAAARDAGVRLVVAGTGRSLDACRAVAGPTTEFLGWVDDGELRDLYRRCRALVYPGLEDFGIVLVEAQACGAPVIALGAGGALDTVIDGATGVLYDTGDDPVAALAHELRSFGSRSFDHRAVATHARQFGAQRFRRDLDDAVGAMLER